LKAHNVEKNGVPDLDRIDLKILAELMGEARASQLELAGKVGLSPTACARRIRQLEESGIIRSYSADLDATALGLVTTVIVTITLEKQSEDYLAAFEAAIARCPDVVSCHLMSGSDDYHLQVLARDIADFERIHKQHLSRMPGVARIHSSFAMREVVRRAIPENALRG
jgi:Lrp/AsnC family transcriptional regulator, leucine-responsive regulatory protein